MDNLNLENIDKIDRKLNQPIHEIDGLNEKGNQDQEFLNRILETIPDLIWLKDPNGIFLDCNPQFEHLLGAKKTEIIGRTDYDFLDKELADFFRENDRKVLESGTSLSNEEWLSFAENGYRGLFETIKSPMRDQSGKVIGVIGIARDITKRNQMEEQLKNRESQLNEAQRIAHIGSWDLDILNKTLSWSDEIFRIFEVDPNKFDASYSAFLEAIHPDDREAVDLAYTNSLENKEPYNIDHRLLFEDGRIKYVNEQCETYFDTDGRPIRSIGVVRDITDQKKLDDALFMVAQRGWMSSNESFFQVLARFLGEMLRVDYVVIDKISDDPNYAETLALYAKGKISNNMCYCIKGSPCENVLGKQFCFYPKDVRNLFPSDTLLVEMGVDSYMGIPLWNSSGLPIGLIALLNSKPIPDQYSAAQILQLVATRAAAEMESERNDQLLRIREQEFRSLIENSPDNIIRYDLDCRVTYANFYPPLTRNASATEMLFGKTPVECFPNGLFEGGKAEMVHYQQVLQAVITNGGSSEVEIKIQVDSGEFFIHSVRFVAEHSMEGDTIGAIAFGRDITESKLSEEKIIRSLHEKEALLREIYHRTRNTMQVIQGILTLQASNTPDDEEIQKLVKETNQRILAISLVHELLYKAQDLSRISIQAYIIELSESIKHNFTEANPGITMEINVKDRNFLLDTAIPIGLVLNELITNSMKYAFPDRRKGIISIFLTRIDSGKNLLHYSDNGIGFCEGFDYRKSKTLGMKLICGIIEIQMMGKVSMNGNNGFSCSMEFQDDLYKARV